MMTAFASRQCAAPEGSSLRLAILVIVSSLAIACGGSKVSDSMSFFVTSESAGDGGNLGGLSGADRVARNWRRPQGLASPNGGRTSAPQLREALPASTRKTGSGLGRGSTRAVCKWPTR